MKKTQEKRCQTWGCNNKAVFYIETPFMILCDKCAKGNKDSKRLKR